MSQVIVTLAGDTLPGLLPAFRRFGIPARRVPLLRFAPPDDWLMVDWSLRRLDRYDAIALTSPRAARSIARRAATVGVAIEPAPVWAVGPTTARALTLSGGHVRLPGPGRPSTAHELASRLLRAQVRTVLFPCGDRRLDVLPRRLQHAGIQVEEVVVYRSRVAEPAVIRQSLVDAAVVVIGSPTVARAIAAAAGPAGTCVVALGDTTAAAAREADLTVAAVAREPTVSGLVDAVRRVLANPPLMAVGA